MCMFVGSMRFEGLSEYGYLELNLAIYWCCSRVFWGKFPVFGRRKDVFRSTAKNLEGGLSTKVSSCSHFSKHTHTHTHTPTAPYLLTHSFHNINMEGAFLNQGTSVDKVRKRRMILFVLE